MKRFNMLYKDAAKHKTKFTLDTELNISTGQEITLQEFGESEETFFLKYVGFDYNKKHDHNMVTVIGEVEKHSGVYLMLEGKMLEADKANLLRQVDKLLIENNGKYNNTYSVTPYRGFLIIELADNIGTYILPNVTEHEGDAMESTGIFPLSQAIERILDRNRVAEKIKAPAEEDKPAFTDKYIVAYMYKDETGEASGKDIYTPFIEQEIIIRIIPAEYNEFTELVEEERKVQEYGRSPKQLAEAFYYKLLEDPELYTANLCKIIASTDYF